MNMMNPNIVNLDYANKKSTGLSSVTKLGDKVFLTIKRFSQEDGSKLPDQVIEVKSDMIQGEIDRLQSMIDAKKLLLGDIEAAKEQK